MDSLDQAKETKNEFLHVSGKAQMSLMRGSRKFIRGWSNSDGLFLFVFLIDEGRTEDPYNTKRGPLSKLSLAKCHLNGVLLAGR